MKKIWATLLGVVVSLGLYAQEHEYDPNLLYVKYRAQKGIETALAERSLLSEQLPVVKNLRERYGIRKEALSMQLFNNPVLATTVQISVEDPQKMNELIKELESDPMVEYVERVSLGRICVEAPVNDPYYGMYEKINCSWHLDLINAEKAWAFGQAKASVKVAVIDNSLWGDHPDLQVKPENLFNVTTGEVGNTTPPASARQDEICSLSDIREGKCFSFSWSHGTHCAGAVGAINNNGIGVSSIGGGVTLMGGASPYSADAGDGLIIKNGYAAIAWAAENGANVISCSWGTSGVSTTEREMIRAVLENGITIVAAAGNTNTLAKSYPAALDGVIGVASVDSDKGFSSFSNYGDWVDIAAPGGYLIGNDGEETDLCILSTTYCQNQQYRARGISGLEGQYYDGMAGTSMACPIVAGLCGLLLSHNPDITPEEMCDILKSTAQAFPEGERKHITENSGVIDAEAAVRLVRSQGLANKRFARDEKIAVYPNPATDKISIRTYGSKTGNITEIRILDLQGRECGKLSGKMLAGEMNVGSLCPGLYVVCVKTDKGVLNAKFSKR